MCQSGERGLFGFFTHINHFFAPQLWATSRTGSNTVKPPQTTSHPTVTLLLFKQQKIEDENEYFSRLVTNTSRMLCFRRWGFFCHILNSRKRNSTYWCNNTFSLIIYVWCYGACRICRQGGACQTRRVESGECAVSCSKKAMSVVSICWNTVKGRQCKYEFSWEVAWDFLISLDFFFFFKYFWFCFIFL